MASHEESQRPSVSHQRYESGLSVKSAQVGQPHTKQQQPLIPTSVSLTTNEKALFQRFILRLAKSMLMYGAPTYRVEARIESIARSKKIPLEILCQPGYILLSFGDIGVSMTSPTTHISLYGNSSSLTQSTVFLKVDQSFNMRKLQELDALTRHVTNAGMEIFAFGMGFEAPSDDEDNNDGSLYEKFDSGNNDSGSSGDTKGQNIDASEADLVGGIRQPAELVGENTRARLKGYEETEVKSGWWSKLTIGLRKRIRSVLMILQPGYIRNQQLRGIEDCLQILDHIILSNNQDPPLWQRCIAQSIMSFVAAVLIFQGKWWDGTISFLLGLLMAVLLYMSERRGLSTMEVWLSFLMFLVIQTIVHFIPGVCLGVTTLSVLMPLYPGISITLAMLEMASKNLTAGTVRMFFSFVRSLSLGFGLSMGSRMFNWITGSKISLTCSYETHVSPSTYLLVIPFTLAACITLKAHIRQWPMMVVVTVVGLVVNRVADYLFQTDVANVLGSIAIGLLSNTYARKSHDIALANTLSAILFMVPGSIGMLGFFSLMESNANAAGANFAMDILIRAMSIALGLYMSNVIYFPIKSSIKSPQDVLTL